MNRKVLVWLSALIIVIVGGAVAWNFTHRKPHLVYQSVNVTRGDIRVMILSTGTVAPENRIDLKAPVAGRVEKVLVQEGNKVHRGQTLAWMSSTERAALVDTAKTKGAEELKYWEDAYKMTPILAPSNGLIILKSADSGQTVTQTDIILSMSDRLIVKASVDETDLAQIKVGQEAETVLDAFARVPLKSKVIHIGYDAKTVNNVTTYEVDVLADQIPDFMKSGMTANITFIVDEKKDVLVVPAAAIHRDHKKVNVMVPNPDGGEPVSHEVEVGLADGKKVEVVSGLKEGDEVMSASMQGLHAKERENTVPFGQQQAPAPRR